MNTTKKDLYWVIAFAALALIAIITFWLGGKGNEIVSYVSFASALVSIVLALVAIFYSIVQNVNSQQNIGEMRTLVSEASQIMKDKADTLVEQAESMEQAVGQLLKDSAKVSGPDMPLTDEIFHFDASEAKAPFLLFLYYVIKCNELKKPIRLLSTGRMILRPTEEASTVKETDKRMSYYSSGIFACLKCFWGSECIPEEGLEVEIRKVPKGFQQNILAIINAQIEAAEPNDLYRTWLENGIKKIDAHLEAA